jgi:hypothetical protein
VAIFVSIVVLVLAFRDQPDGEDAQSDVHRKRERRREDLRRAGQKVRRVTILESHTVRLRGIGDFDDPPGFPLVVFPHVDGETAAQEWDDDHGSDRVS